jgi:poly(3-hydroxybutyrate) depolymerase
VQAVIQEMRQQVNVGDIFANGESNGGMFLHALMTTMPTTFKAIVPFYGLPLIGQWELGPHGVPSNLAGTSVFYLHGRSDHVIPADGGLMGGWYYVSEEQAMSQIAKVNGCSSSTQTWSTPYDGGRDNVKCTRHTGCPSGVTVGHCLYNGGHATPSFGESALFWFLKNYEAASTEELTV